MNEIKSFTETIAYYKREAAIGITGVGLTLGADIDKGFSWTFSSIGAIATAGMVAQSLFKKKRSEQMDVGFAELKAYQFVPNGKHANDNLMVDEMLSGIYDPKGIIRDHASNNQQNQEDESTNPDDYNEMGYESDENTS